MRTRAPRPLVLLLGGSDPSGGAGVELDLKVLALLGVQGAAVATCHTIQTACGLEDFEPAATRLAKRQLAALARDAAIGVVKIGMVPSAEWARLAARTLDRLPRARSLFDPVLQPTLGRRVLSRSALQTVIRELLPRVDLLMPNALEAAELLGVPLAEVARDPDATARALVELGAKSVLLKGGHLAAAAAARGARRGAVIDRLRGAAGDFDLATPRQGGASPRGTGCALASAIAAGLLHGLSMERAVGFATRWLATARRAARRHGAGRPYLGLVAVDAADFGAKRRR